MNAKVLIFLLFIGVSQVYSQDEVENAVQESSTDPPSSPESSIESDLKVVEEKDKTVLEFKPHPIDFDPSLADVWPLDAFKARADDDDDAQLLKERHYREMIVDPIS
jgi:hypothetical protein